VNAVPEGRANWIPREKVTAPERSDAGVVIVQEVFGMSTQMSASHLERSERLALMCRIHVGGN
jgi:hypothetical protein